MFAISDIINFFPLLIYLQIYFDDYSTKNEYYAPVNISCGLSLSPYEPPSVKEKKDILLHVHKEMIIDGNVVINASSLPWMAVLFNAPPYNKFPCSATIISANHILTAGHCLLPYLIAKTHNSTGPWKPAETDWFKIRVGTVDWNGTKGGIDISSRKIYPHPNYIRDGSFQNDIAILELETSLEFSPIVQSICLPAFDGTTTMPGKRAFISGWGQTQRKEYDVQTKLHIGTVQFLGGSVCKKQDPKFKQNMNFCSRAYPSDACEGDSGGALLQKIKISNETRWFQFGVMVADLGNIHCQWPTVHIRIDSKCEWIREVTEGQANCIHNVS